MGLLTFPPDDIPIIGDSSVWINLVASGHAAPIIQVIPNRLLISDVALSELERGRITGRMTMAGVEQLIDQGLIAVVKCPDEAEDTYLSLVLGSAKETLDDGEACTLAYAHHGQIAALIDEKKATEVAHRRFPGTLVLSTTDLLLSPNVQEHLGEDATAKALFNALVGAYMRVPIRCLTDVLAVLGEDRASQCPSLPASARRR